jgi:hypothetical protein
MMLGSLLLWALLVAGCTAHPNSGAIRQTTKSAPAHETTLTVTGHPAWNERLIIALSVPGGPLKAGVRYPAVISETNEGTAAVSIDTWDLVARDSTGRKVFDWAVASGESKKHVGHRVPIFLAPGRNNRQAHWFELPGTGTFTLALAVGVPGPNLLPTATVEAR